ncbi:sensor histidine kinase [Jiella sp. M17.18]|uniref:sensor histidine kinase n=1 Tax=Jiella sp. M17.18 TaxID=3234247 RepID=UPI0034E0001E
MADQDRDAAPAFVSDLLREGGRMGAAIAGKDWSKTSLGPFASWERSLLTVLRLVLATRQPICFWWGPDLLQFHNDAYLPMLWDRAETALGAPARELWADVWPGVEPMVDAALSGRGTWNENLPLQIVRNGSPRDSFWTFSYSPLHDDRGEIVGLLNIVTETTDAVQDRAGLAEANRLLAEEVERTKAALAAQREAERRQHVLQRELSHRLKNTLAIVQAVVSQSLRHAASPEEAAQLAFDRIGALDRAQDMLTTASWEAADIGAVVAAAVEPHRDRGDRITLAGPSADVSAKQAMGLSLALHELATNATKYGALSVPAGRVAINWGFDADGGLFFEWQETGGPAVAPPKRKGFGARLTERVVPAYFEGSAVLEYHPDGVRYRLTGAPDAALAGAATI